MDPRLAKGDEVGDEVCCPSSRGVGRGMVSKLLPSLPLGQSTTTAKTRALYHDLSRAITKPILRLIISLLYPHSPTRLSLRSFVSRSQTFLPSFNLLAQPLEKSTTTAETRAPAHDLSWAITKPIARLLISLLYTPLWQYTTTARIRVLCHDLPWAFSKPISRLLISSCCPLPPSSTGTIHNNYKNTRPSWRSFVIRSQTYFPSPNLSLSHLFTKGVKLSRHIGVAHRHFRHEHVTLLFHLSNVVPAHPTFNVVEPNTLTQLSNYHAPLVAYYSQREKPENCYRLQDCIV